MKRQGYRDGKSWFLASAAVVLAAAVGFGVPFLLRSWQDEKRMTEVTTESAAPVRIISQTELGISEKAKLMMSAEANTTTLEKGRNYDAASCLTKAKEEVQTLCDRGVLDETFRSAEILEEEEEALTPIFYIDSGGEKSMILWMLSLSVYTEKDSWMLEAALDDETGKFLGLSLQKWDGDSTEGMYTDSDPTELVQEFGEYLELTVERVTENESAEGSEAEVQVLYAEEDGAEVSYHISLGLDSLEIFVGY